MDGKSFGRVVGGDGVVPQGAVGQGDVRGERVAGSGQDLSTPQTSRSTGAIPKTRRQLVPPTASLRTPLAQPPSILRPRSEGALVRDPSLSWWDVRESGGPEVYPLRSKSALPPDKHPLRSASALPMSTPGREYLTPIVSVHRREENRTPSLHFKNELRRMEEEERKAAEVKRRVAETANYVRQSLEQQRKDQRTLQGRERLRQDTETVERLADTEVEGFNIDYRGVRQDLEEQRQRQERLERRSQGQTPSSSSTEEGLAGTFKHLGKVLASLNSPRSRDNPVVLSRNTQHLNKITEDKIVRGLGRSIEPLESMIEERISETVARLLVETEDRIKTTIEQTLASRVDRLEDLERLTVRANTEKLSSLRPLDYYPSHAAPEDVYRKALAQMTGTVRVIERSLTFDKEPFNFLLRLAEASNKIAEDFELNEDQQRSIILSNVPSISAVYRFIIKARDLWDMMSLINTMATQVNTRTELEQKINQWRLDRTSETQLYLSIIELLDYLDKIRDGYGFEDAHPPTLIREAVSIILRQENPPQFIQEKLHTARIQIHDSDGIGEITKILISACLGFLEIRKQRLFHVRSLAFPANVYSIQENVEEHDGQEEEAQDDQDEGEEHEDEGEDDDHQDDYEEDADEDDNDDGYDNDNYQGDDYRPRFVKPWPQGKKYRARNGRFRSEFETHFAGFCHRCGHSSHFAANCRIYRDFCDVLCEVCRQGCHTICRSRRTDLQRKNQGNETLANLLQLTQYLHNKLGQFKLPRAPTPANQDYSESDSGSTESDD
jgi:hypothetical protein